MSEILKYGRPELREKSKLVDEVTDEIRDIVKDMLSTMYSHNGVGLAAEQIGRDEAICVVDVTGTGDPSDAPPPVPMPLILINPKIEELEGDQVGPEGCLSFPEIYVNIRRAEEATVSYLDIDGKPQRVRGSGLLARALQHEIDHLNGVLLVDRMSPVQRVSVSGRLKRLSREAKLARS